jgi:iron complex outermembrane receptor protein
VGQDPKAEELRDLEIGYRGSSKRLLFNANYYFMSYNNQLVPTGALNDTGASLRTNVDQSYRMGIELEGVFKITPQLTWNANVTLSENKIKDFTEVTYDYGENFDAYNEVKITHKDTDIAFSPRVIAGSSLSYQPIRQIEATLLTKYVGSQYLDNTSNKARSIDAYLINDVRLSYTARPSFMKEFVLSLLVNNVLDKKYESNGYTWGYLGGTQVYRENYYFPQAGRNFMIMATLRF